MLEKLLELMPRLLATRNAVFSTKRRTRPHIYKYIYCLVGSYLVGAALKKPRYPYRTDAQREKFHLYYQLEEASSSPFLGPAQFYSAKVAAEFPGYRLVEVQPSSWLRVQEPSIARKRVSKQDFLWQFLSLRGASHGAGKSGAKGWRLDCSPRCKAGHGGFASSQHGLALPDPRQDIQFSQHNLLSGYMYLETYVACLLLAAALATPVHVQRSWSLSCKL